MYYEILVCKKVRLQGRDVFQHLFATADRSARSEVDGKKVFDEIKARFPEKDGYKVTATLYQHTGEELDWGNPDQAKLDAIVGQ